MSYTLLSPITQFSLIAIIIGKMSYCFIDDIKKSGEKYYPWTKHIKIDWPFAHLAYYILTMIIGFMPKEILRRNFQAFPKFSHEEEMSRFEYE